VLSQDEEKQNKDEAVSHCAADPVKIEQLAKDFRIHWCALDFDKGFTATGSATAITERSTY
jgi:hypothetical protein